jgi:DNA repair exonuclease SbcCD ATPase subunit
MSEETKEATTSDEALNQAAEQTTEETPKTEETASETKTEEPSVIEKELQQTKSELGRAQKAMGEMSSMKDEISSLKSLLENQATQKQTANEAENIVTTEQDVRGVFNRLEVEKREKAAKYDNDYLNHIAKLANADKLSDDNLQKIEEVLKTSVTSSKSNFTNFVMDAEINYRDAKLILAGKGDKSVNLKGDTPTGTGIGKPSENGGSDKTTMPKLDPVAQEYAEKMGMSAEDVNKALKGL